MRSQNLRLPSFRRDHLERAKRLTTGFSSALRDASRGGRRKNAPRRRLYVRCAGQELYKFGRSDGVMGKRRKRTLLSLTLRTAPAVSISPYALTTANIYLFTCSGRISCKRKITTLGNAARGFPCGLYSGRRGRQAVPDLRPTDGWRRDHATSKKPPSGARCPCLPETSRRLERF